LLLAISATLAFGQAGLPDPAGGGSAPGTPPAGGAAPWTKKQELSYAVGYDFGTSLRIGEADLDVQAIAAGLADGLLGRQSQLSEEQLGTLLAAFQKEMQAREAAQMKQYAAQNKKTAQAYLAANKEKPGVKVTATGLQYRVLKEGTGPSPTATDIVRVHYRGTHIDGDEFDSSYARGEPAQFPVGKVIKGWTEALQRMRVGDKWQLFIPPELGYGEQGIPGGPIGPNEVLVFEVELLEIVAQ
jgi:FKBP-type peptidyl-prolyl cis-trans isomerase